MNYINTISVKVMRSYDYCHFEIQLSATCDGTTDPLEMANDLRKDAARLADKSVAQYKIAKSEWDKADYDRAAFDRLQEAAAAAAAKPENDRTPKDKATIKKLADRLHYARRAFDYQEDFNGDDGDYDYSLSDDLEDF